MDIIEKIRNMVLRFLRIDHLSEDPTDDRLTFINTPRTSSSKTLAKHVFGSWGIATNF